MEKMDSGPGQPTPSNSSQSVIIEMTSLSGDVGIEMSPVSREVTGKYFLKHILYITLTYSQ